MWPYKSEILWWAGGKSPFALSSCRVVGGFAAYILDDRRIGDLIMGAAQGPLK